MKKGFLSNKYTLSVIILLAILGVDIILHKGMSRVMLPESFTEKRSPSANKPGCTATLLSTNKSWIKAVNNVSLVNSLDSSKGGIEMDVYFDTAKNTFFVYHDSSAISTTTALEILTSIAKQYPQFSVWFDFKNLNSSNLDKSLTHLKNLRKQLGLNNKIVVESSDIKLLSTFCENGFYSSYYTPFFNPYQDEELELLKQIDSISSLTKSYKVNALSGYYFQAPFLRKYFPNFPVLTWTDQPDISIISTLFNRQLLGDDQIQVVLYPVDN